MSQDYHEIEACRACTSQSLADILPFGLMPLSDGLRTADQLLEVEPKFPLTLAFCNACSLVQIRENVSPTVLFGDDYPYYSSFSDAWVAHCRDNALELIEERQLNASSQVIEIACNDGYMLRNFTERGIPVLGVDPVPGPVSKAREHGIDVLQEFFTPELSHHLQQQGTTADVLLANNVLAHVPDLSGFVEGIANVLKADGVAVIEAPYVRDLIDKCEFDTIYHEHHCYFSVTALQKLFASKGLCLNRVRRLPTHGGSLRLYVEPSARPDGSVERLLKEEYELGINRVEYYESFASRVRTVQSQLLKLLNDLKSRGHRIAGYAAAAKGAILLNSAGVEDGVLDYVVDRNTHKHDRFMPGMNLPIRDTSLLEADQPDYVLILAWNFQEEILQQQDSYRRAGGRFIIPIPEPTII